MNAPRSMRGLAAVALASVLAFSACEEERRPAAAPAPRKAAPAAAAAAPAAAEGAAADAQFVYTYNPVGKRDPFRSPLELAPAQGGVKRPDETAACTDVLCQYALDELHLVAVISGDANPMAMVEDRSGIGHIVRRNTKVGKAGGKVTQVLRDCIVITSFVQTSDGKAQPVKTNMCVSRDKRAAPVLDLLQGKLRE
jgi:type IV pilus assembly protein PilP